MANKFKNIFKTKNSVIGALHFMPLLGYGDYRGIDRILKKAVDDLQTFEKGGVDGIIVENNYDVPHAISVGAESIACMTYLTKEIVRRTKLPIGVSVLWNAYKAALAIAKVCGGKFIRVPVFVDNVRTSYGDVFGNPDDLVNYRKQIGAEDVLLLTDIHVKHAILLSKFSIAQSARQAVIKGSDGLIITGKWTADAPVVQDLVQARNAVGDFPIVIGSGATIDNIVDMLQYADGVIVGTSLKTGRSSKKKVNIKGYNEKIDSKKVKAFMQKVKQI